jgi:hypothetical protein
LPACNGIALVMENQKTDPRHKGGDQSLYRLVKSGDVPYLNFTVTPKPSFRLFCTPVVALGRAAAIAAALPISYCAFLA